MGEVTKKERNDTARWILSKLVDADFTRALVATDEDRHRIIVATADDPMSEVHKRIKAGKSPVTLCVKVGTGVVLVSFKKVSTQEEADDCHDLAPNATLGMFVSYLLERGAPVTFRIKKPVQMAFELALA